MRERGGILKRKKKKGGGGNRRMVSVLPGMAGNGNGGDV
jgi:hypothetical protein